MAITDLDEYKKRFEYFGFGSERFLELVNSITYNFNSETDGDFNDYCLYRVGINYNNYIEKLVLYGTFNYFLNEYLFHNYDGTNLAVVLNDFFDIINYHPNLSMAKNIVLKNVDLQKLFYCQQGKFIDNNTVSVLYDGFNEILKEEPELVKSNSKRDVPLFFERKGLFEQIKSGDLEARNAFLLNNLGLVKKVIFSFTSDSELYDDYYQTGCMALLKAVDNFDFTKGYKFSTYAYKCIINSLYKYYGSTCYSFTVPINIHDLICKYEKLRYQYEARGEKVNDDEVCDILEISTKELKLIKGNYHAVSIYDYFNRYYASYNDAAVGDSFLPIIENIPGNLDVADSAEAEFLSEEIDRIIEDANLSDNEKFCMLRYFGFIQDDQKGTGNFGRSTYYFYKNRAVKKIARDERIGNLAGFIGVSDKTNKKVKNYFKRKNN